MCECTTKNAQRYMKWRADHTRGPDAEITPLGLTLSDAWTAEQVDAALDAAPALEQKLSPMTAEVEHLRHCLELQQASYEREREIDQAEIERMRDVVAHAVAELEPLDDETAQAQARALRELLGA